MRRKFSDEKHYCCLIFKKKKRVLIKNMYEVKYVNFALLFKIILDSILDHKSKD